MFCVNCTSKKIENKSAAIIPQSEVFIPQSAGITKYVHIKSTTVYACIAPVV